MSPRKIPAASQRVSRSNGLRPTDQIRPMPVTGMVSATGITCLTEMVFETRVAKLPCIGSAPPMAPMIGNAKLGPKAMIAPST